MLYLLGGPDVATGEVAQLGGNGVELLHATDGLHGGLRLELD